MKKQSHLSNFHCFNLNPSMDLEAHIVKHVPHHVWTLKRRSDEITYVAAVWCNQFSAPYKEDLLADIPWSHARWVIEFSGSSSIVYDESSGGLSISAPVLALVEPLVRERLVNQLDRLLAVQLEETSPHLRIPYAPENLLGRLLTLIYFMGVRLGLTYVWKPVEMDSSKPLRPDVAYYVLRNTPPLDKWTLEERELVWSVWFSQLSCRWRCHPLRCTSLSLTIRVPFTINTIECSCDSQSHHSPPLFAMPLSRICA